jgi:hypothetical protein
VEGSRSAVRLPGLIFTAVGALMTGGGVWLFVKESKTWDLRNLTAERVVSGGLLFEFALMMIWVRFTEEGGLIGTTAMVAAGTVDVTFFLALGLAFAYAPALRVRRRLAGVWVERRYALDDKLNEIDGHPCPQEDGFTPVVTLRMRDERTRTMVCAESAYEILDVGRRRTAVVRGKRLERFH